MHLTSTCLAVWTITNPPNARPAWLRGWRSSLCDEVWQWGKTITEGMAAELARAKELGIPIKVYNTLGIPYEQWNSVKLANDPTYIAECRKAGREL